MSWLDSGLALRTPEGKDLWLQLTTGNTQYSSPFISEFAETKSAELCAYWGDVTEEGNDHVLPRSTRLCVSHTAARATSHLIDQDCTQSTHYSQQGCDAD